MRKKGKMNGETLARTTLSRQEVGHFALMPKVEGSDKSL